jgi:dTDP-4-dehydrorhamnose 3,5-epimerase
MTFTETPFEGLWLIDLTPFEDARGFFAVTWMPEAFTSRGLDPTVVQCNLAWNHRRGTIRGMHFQRAPFEEVKIVRCTRGVMYDVVIDLRPKSNTYGKWFPCELTEHNRRMLYIPSGFAHGYQTLTDGVEAYYHVSTPYSPAHASGVRWNDPRFGIRWPLALAEISTRDAEWPDFNDASL